MMSGLLMSSPSLYLREWGFAEWAKGRILGDMAVEMMGPPKLVMIW